MTKEIKQYSKHRKVICDLTSEMLDNLDEYGTYPTTRFYEKMEEYISQALQKQRKEDDIGNPNYLSVRSEVAKLSGVPTMAITLKEHLNVIEKKVKQALQKRDEECNEIFKWLLGESGDFPDLSQKPHYSFRSELRSKLSTLTNK